MFSSNDNSSASWKSLKLMLFIVILFGSADSSQSAMEGGGAEEREGSIQWEILTQKNFSSQFRLHSHVLVLITVPWSGKSRSMMKKLCYAVNHKERKYGLLKLRLVYRNTEKVLADAIGARDEATIVFYHHSVLYRYSGRFRAENILSSCHHVMSSSPGEFPVKTLKIQEHMKKFIESTDRAIILFEFCGWDSRILHVQNTTIENQKNNRFVSSDAPNGSWYTKFGLLMSNFSVNDKKSHDLVTLCSKKEFRKFKSFFLRFMAVAREHSLPPERQRFGIVSDQSMLRSLGIKKYGSWFAAIPVAGCYSSSKIYKDGGEFNDAIEKGSQLVTQLDSDGIDLVRALPGNEISIMLFIDRASVSPKVKRKSKEALHFFREFALQYETSCPSSRPSKIKKSVSPDKEESHPEVKVFSTAKKVSFINKGSISILNSEVPVSLNNILSGIQGQPLGEIVKYFFHHPTEENLDVLSKDVGFRILRNDYDLKEVNMVASQGGDGQSNHKSPEVSDGHLDLPEGTSNGFHHVDNLEKLHKQTATTIEFSQGLTLDLNVDIKVDEANMLQEAKMHKQILGCDAVKTSFFIADGGDQLLTSLTGSSKVPSIVIIDPIKGQHYVFQGDSKFRNSSLANFYEKYRSGSLLPYQKSISLIRNSRESIKPPFVNQDFHEADSIPRITVQQFSRIVFNSLLYARRKVDHGHRRDLLILFTTSWCGVCQRMELVIREVYRALKRFAEMVKRAYGNNDINEVAAKGPLIYLMDCTINDCSLMLRRVGQQELYPLLLLFQADQSAVPYDGGVTVTSIIKFIADHGNDFANLFVETGLLSRTDNKTQVKKDSLATLVEKDEHNEIILPLKMLETEVKSKKSQSHEVQSPHVISGFILLATDKLNGVQFFEKSIILIVRADRATGFQGVIVNQQISWDSFEFQDRSWEYVREAPLFVGGPVVELGKPLLALSDKASKHGSMEVVPGIFFLDPSETLDEIESVKSRNESFGNYWFFLGYASWSWDQLINEISGGAWHVSHNTTKYFSFLLRH